MNFGQRGVSGQGVTLPFLIQEAYHVHDFQIEGVPEKLASAKYDFVAKMDDPSADKGGGDNASPDQQKAFEELTRQRLQSLLATRFGLRVHSATEERSVLALSIAPGGPRLTPTQHPKGGFVRNHFTEHSRQSEGENVSMTEYAENLGFITHHLVQDRTGLSGKYDFKVDYAPEDDPEPNPSVAPLPVALREQLGLLLKPAKGMVVVYHVDHVEAPSPN